MNHSLYYLTFLFISIIIVIVNADKYNTNRTNHRMIHPNRSLQQSSSESNSVSTLTSKIIASNGVSSNYFGSFNAVAISNNRIVVGAFGYNSFTGAAYLFMDPANPESGRSYSQMAILLASDGQVDDVFGTSVDIDGDIIVVGASEDYSGGNGAVYIFRIGDNDNISQVAKITAQNGATHDYFGHSVAIQGNFILVGAYGVDLNGISDVGSAYLFVNTSNDPDNSEWTQIMQFQPNDLTVYYQFGTSVAMEDEIAVIGTLDSNDANAAYVFVPVDNIDSLSLWTQKVKLTGPTDSYFGYSVAVAGNIIVVGAPNYVKNNGNYAGAVFVFTKMDDSSSSSSSLTWTQTNILLAADGAEGDWFGYSVAISKDASTIVVGAYQDDYNSTITDSGAAYLFQNSNTTTTTMTIGWTQVGKYVAADRDTGDYLGSSIAIENSIVVVGAYGDDTGTGSVFILDTENSPSPPPPPTTTPIPTTTAPTAEPVVPTFQPTTSPTTRPTDPPITNSPTTIAPSTNNGGDGNTENLSSPPVTSIPTTDVPAASTPTPPSNNITATPKDPTNDPSSNSNNNNVIIAAIGGASVVILGLGIAFFNYRLKREDRLRLQLQQQQQQQQQISPPPSMPPPSSGENRMEAIATDEAPIMANVIVLPPTQLTEDRTLEAGVLLDPPPAHKALDGNMDVIDAEKGLPHYKDQTRHTGPPGSSRRPPPLPIRNSQASGTLSRKRCRITS